MPYPGYAIRINPFTTLKGLHPRRHPGGRLRIEPLRGSQFHWFAIRHSAALRNPGLEDVTPSAYGSGGWHGKWIVCHGRFGRAEAGTRRPFRRCRQPCSDKTPPCDVNPNGVPSFSPGFGERSDAVPWVRNPHKSIYNPERVAPAAPSGWASPNRTPSGFPISLVCDSSPRAAPLRSATLG
jgi:hypothetical protein